MDRLEFRDFQYEYESCFPCVSCQRSVESAYGDLARRRHPSSDLDRNGVVDLRDFATFAVNFGS